MKPKTIKSYRELIAEKCLYRDFKEVPGYLNNPTPSNIRKACMQLFEKRNGKFDFIILDQFFHFNDEKNAVKEIRKFDIDKFRPIQNFITNKTIKPTTEVLELTAWLIGFQPRPYSEYQKSDEIIIKEVKEKSKPSILDDNNSNMDNIGKITNKYWRYVLIPISIVFILFFINYNINFSSKKNEKSKCLIWSDIQYIAISCNTKVDGKDRIKIVPMSEKLLKMKKVELKRSDAIFDKNDKPLYWYYISKSKGIEFYNTDGFHPINDKHLKSITKGIFYKYVPIHDDIGNSFVNPNTK